MATKKKDIGATFSAVVIVDPPSMGGEVRMLIDGHTFVLRGRVVRGLRNMAHERDQHTQNSLKALETTKHR